MNAQRFAEENIGQKELNHIRSYNKNMEQRLAKYFDRLSNQREGAENEGEEPYHIRNISSYKGTEREKKRNRKRLIKELSLRDLRAIYSRSNPASNLNHPRHLRSIASSSSAGH
jgi:hypothetical protein